MTAKQMKVIHIPNEIANHVLVNINEFDESITHVVITIHGNKEQIKFRVKRSPEIGVNFIACVMSEVDWLTYDFPKGKLVNVTPLTDVPESIVSHQNIAKDNWNYENTEIGGLDEQFTNIFKKVILPRLLLQKGCFTCEQDPIKGILLHGPPGTGKSLIARKCKELLKTTKTVIVNGPEILSKFVGESEHNIRNLFKDAEIEFKEEGHKSGLHLIIFDEIDAICRERGSSIGSSYVYDGIVNQLLCKFDGVEKLDNFLIIGTTNRIDLIDEALLRAGRFEIKIEMPLPNVEGRKQIFEIHTKKYKEKGYLANDVDLDYLASKTRNYTGAEIKDVVKFAAGFANEKLITMNTFADFDPNAIELFLIQKEHFERALEDVQPAFGSNERKIKQLIGRHIQERRYFPTSASVNVLFEQSSTGLVSLLFVGPPKCGKTASAADAALKFNIPFIRICSSENMVAFTEREKCHRIKKDFEESYKSDFSCVIVNNVERLIDYNPLGNQFSNMILQTLLTVLKKPPPANKKLLIICTTSSKDLLQEMGLLSTFSRVLDGITSPANIDNYFETINTAPNSIRIPDACERKQLIESYVKKYMDSFELASDVNFDQIVSLTKNYSSAEIENLVKCVEKYASARTVKDGQFFTLDPKTDEKSYLQQNDFLRALKNNVITEYGVSECTLKQYIKNGIIRWGLPVQSIIDNMGIFINQAKNSSHGLVTVLFEGSPNSGKTAHAAHFAMQSNFPFIRICSTDKMISLTEAEKCNRIWKDFEDSYKSDFSCVIVDNIERIIGYNKSRKRYSNEILQTLLIGLTKPPPNDRKLLILCTTSCKELLEEIDILHIFNGVINVPMLTEADHVIAVLRQHSSINNVRFCKEELKLIKILIEEKPFEIGIKKLLAFFDMSIEMKFQYRMQFFADLVRKENRLQNVNIL